MTGKIIMRATVGLVLLALAGGAFAADKLVPYEEDEAIVSERTVCGVRLLAARLLFKIGPSTLNLDYPMPALLVNREAWQKLERPDRIDVLHSLQCILAGPGREADIDIRARTDIDLLQRWRAGRLY